MPTVGIDYFEARFPRRLNRAEKTRAEVLLGDAAEVIEAAFLAVGEDLAAALQRREFLFTYRRVIVEMVGAAITVGGDAKRRSRSVSAGAVSESYTWADDVSTAWVGVELTDEQRRDLGQPVGGRSRGRFPRAPRWPERRM